jgi:hypothetical protein
MRACHEQTYSSFLLVTLMSFGLFPHMHVYIHTYRIRKSVIYIAIRRDEIMSVARENFTRDADTTTFITSVLPGHDSVKRHLNDEERDADMKPHPGPHTHESNVPQASCMAPWPGPPRALSPRPHNPRISVFGPRKAAQKFFIDGHRHQHAGEIEPRGTVAGCSTRLCFDCRCSLSVVLQRCDASREKQKGPKRAIRDILTKDCCFEPLGHQSMAAACCLPCRSWSCFLHALAKSSRELNT